jgi:RNA polymerase sigma-70 factor (ECF subfamily)
MPEPPPTRASLLVRLRDPRDTEAWRQFVQLYASVVYGYARRRGLQDADAADLMQEVFRAVAASAGRLDYDPRRGTFRGWLFTVTRNKLYNFLDGRKRHAAGSGDSGAQEALAEKVVQTEDAAALWDQEYERRVFAWAAEQVRGEFEERTWQAFWRTAVEGESAKDAGSRLGMSPGAVYVAKSRVLARLKEQVRLLEDEGHVPEEAP